MQGALLIAVGDYYWWCEWDLWMTLRMNREECPLSWICLLSLVPTNLECVLVRAAAITSFCREGKEADASVFFGNQVDLSHGPIPVQASLLYSVLCTQEGPPPHVAKY